MFRTNTDAPESFFFFLESEVNGQEHSEEISPEVSHHSPDPPQPQPAEIVPQKLDIPPKNTDRQEAETAENSSGCNSQVR